MGYAELAGMEANAMMLSAKICRKCSKPVNGPRNWCCKSWRSAGSRKAGAQTIHVQPVVKEALKLLRASLLRPLEIAADI